MTSLTLSIGIAYFHGSYIRFSGFWGFRMITGTLPRFRECFINRPDNHSRDPERVHFHMPPQY